MVSHGRQNVSQSLTTPTPILGLRILEIVSELLEKGVITSSHSGDQNQSEGSYGTASQEGGQGSQQKAVVQPEESSGPGT